MAENDAHQYGKKISFAFRYFLIKFFQGILTGAGAILPGVSGGVLSVSFGIYRPLMYLLEHPVKAIRKYRSLFIPFGLGWCAGFWIFARLLALLFTLSEQAAVCLFIGMIAGTCPSLWQEANKRGRTRASWTALTLVFAAAFAFFVILGNAQSVNVTPNAGWFFFCGLLWGLSVVVPGMSSSTLLIFLGLYEPLLEAAGRLDIGVGIPMAAGILLVVVTMSRFVNRMFEKHYHIIYFCVLGFIAATTLVIVPLRFNGALDAVLSFAMAAGGFAVALWMDRLGQKLEREKQEAEAAE